ncbi:hypothetical protein Poly21_07310 [Allorhodopirellula heiligendammensis]|uniref:Uncharacterized protein n=2 Tax=Allorhodopirellula heiligendammensis TaxID=2714739 RepID=A0A5C6C3H3_9BACT|nr:hypothetical protein Poly21_07310 [Allorhodopirellula heiligendammensis]
MADGHAAAIQGLPGIRASGTGGPALPCCVPPQTLLPFGGQKPRRSHSTDGGRDERETERLLDDGRGGGIPGRLVEHATGLGQAGKDCSAGQSSEQLPVVSSQGPADIPRLSGQTGDAKSEVMAIVPQAVAQLPAQPDQPSSSFLLGIPWYHNVVLIEKIIDAMDVQVDLSGNALNSAEVHESL